MYVYCVESYAHIECYSDCSRRGDIWLNPFATVLFTVCSAVTIESVVCCTRVAWVFAVMSLQVLRRWIRACMRCPCLCLCGVLGWDYVSQLPYVWYYVGVKRSFQHTREECESKRVYVF